MSAEPRSCSAAGGAHHQQNHNTQIAGSAYGNCLVIGRKIARRTAFAGADGLCIRRWLNGGNARGHAPEPQTDRDQDGHGKDPAINLPQPASGQGQRRIAPAKSGHGHQRSSPLDQSRWPVQTAPEGADKAASTFHNAGPVTGEGPVVSAYHFKALQSTIPTRPVALAGDQKSRSA